MASAKGWREAPEMTDVVFELKGHSVAVDYMFALWSEVARILPWLETETYAGIHPLKVAASGLEMLMPRRTKLVLRVPQARAAQAADLSGEELRIGSSVLHVGAATERPLQAYPTLHAHVVASECTEQVFIAGVTCQLEELNVSCKWLCGKRHVIEGTERTLAGYSLVLHDLKPEESLRIQRYGLGGERHFGCGIFVPYKTITGLG